jgi:murein DD-endopeptidase MepM/ murein hydrolase activator NlpD
VDEPDSYEQKASYTLPFRGEWYVFNGGPDRATSHSWDVVAQRYAYDFVIADDALRRWREDKRGAELDDYLCYGEPVLSPAEGTVVEVRDDVRDAPSPGTGWMDPFAADIRGNYVVIKHAEDEYSVLGHLLPGSLAVREGDGVCRGQELGLCGNSGNSSEPHLHFQVQDRQDFFTAAGLPVAFDGVSVDGARHESGRYLERGERVSDHQVRTKA